MSTVDINSRFKIVHLECPPSLNAHFLDLSVVALMQEARLDRNRDSSVPRIDRFGESPVQRVLLSCRLGRIVRDEVDQFECDSLRGIPR